MGLSQTTVAAFFSLRSFKSQLYTETLLTFSTHFTYSPSFFRKTSWKPCALSAVSSESAVFLVDEQSLMWNNRLCSWQTRGPGTKSGPWQQFCRPRRCNPKIHVIILYFSFTFFCHFLPFITFFLIFCHLFFSFCDFFSQISPIFLYYLSHFSHFWSFSSMTEGFNAFCSTKLKIKSSQMISNCI